MNANEQLIRKIAEEIANKTNGDRLRSVEHVYRSKEMIKAQKESIISESIPAACIAVAHMAEAYKSAYWSQDNIWYGDEQNIPEWKLNSLQNDLIERGLIPEKTE